jgi:hypothetical protein
VNYGAATSVARDHGDQEVYVVGGGNSARRAAVHLARFAKSVTMVIRRRSLLSTMSSTSCARSKLTGDHPACEVVDGGGERWLQWLTLRNRGRHGGGRASGLMLLLGADPCNEWLPEGVARDDETSSSPGATCASSGRPSSRRPRSRRPCPACLRSAPSNDVDEARRGGVGERGRGPAGSFTWTRPSRPRLCAVDASARQFQALSCRPSLGNVRLIHTSDWRTAFTVWDATCPPASTTSSSWSARSGSACPRQRGVYDRALPAPAPSSSSPRR